MTERVWWLAYDGMARYPKTAAALAGAVTATTPVTLRHVAGVVIAGATVSGVIFADGSRRARLESVQRWAKFRQRRRRVRRRWVAVMADCGMVAAPVHASGPKRLPRLLRVSVTSLGVRLVVNGAPVSVAAADFRAKADRLRAGFACREVRAVDQGARVILDLHWRDPFARIVPARTLPRPSRRLHVVIGVDEHGKPVEKDLRLPNLVVGAQGAGKSSEVWTLLHGLQRAGIPHRVRVFDPKGGQEFAELDDAAWHYERDPTRWAAFLEHALGALTVRQAVLRKQGHRVCPFTAEHPLDVALIDELVTALAFDRGKVKVGGKTMSAADAFMVYLSQARSAGFTVVALSQLGEKAVIGPVRGLFGYATCLRVGPTESELVDMLLGSRASKAYPAHQLPADGSAAGVGWMATAAGVVKYRAALLTEPERRAVVKRMAVDTARMRKRDDQEVTDA